MEEPALIMESRRLAWIKKMKNVIKIFQNQIFMIRTIRNFIRNVLHCVKIVSVTNKHFHTKKKMN